MAFTPLNRPRALQQEPFRSTPAQCIRLASHRAHSGGGKLLIFWLGLEVAQKVGLIHKRQMVSLLVDDDGPVRRIAIRPDPLGDFRASRRLSAFSVHVDMVTTDKLLGSDGHVWCTIPGDELVYSAGMVAFPFAVERLQLGGH